MQTVNKIMVAVDFSQYSPAAVRYAVDLAKDVGAEVLLVNVYNQRDINVLKKIEIEYPKFSFNQYYEENLLDRRSRLEALADECKSEAPDVKTVSLVLAGVPHEELLKAIDDRQPDLLVVGIKGRSNLMDALTGSCARRLFRHSPIPVLSIRRRHA